MFSEISTCRPLLLWQLSTCKHWPNGREQPVTHIRTLGCIRKAAGLNSRISELILILFISRLMWIESKALSPHLWFWRWSLQKCPTLHWRAWRCTGRSRSSRRAWSWWSRACGSSWRRTGIRDDYWLLCRIKSLTNQRTLPKESILLKNSYCSAQCWCFNFKVTFSKWSLLHKNHLLGSGQFATSGRVLTSTIWHPHIQTSLLTVTPFRVTPPVIVTLFN